MFYLFVMYVYYKYRKEAFRFIILLSKKLIVNETWFFVGVTKCTQNGNRE